MSSIDILDLSTFSVDLAAAGAAFFTADFFTAIIIDLNEAYYDNGTVKHLRHEKYY